MKLVRVRIRKWGKDHLVAQRHGKILAWTLCNQLLTGQKQYRPTRRVCVQCRKRLEKIDPAAAEALRETLTSHAEAHA